MTAAGLNTCMTWSNLELRGLLEDEDARVRFERAKRHLALHPFHLNDLNRAIREILDANVNSYVDELRGLVLAYKNPKLLGPLGAILHDSHFIHVDVEADFYVFEPQIGCVLKGIANKKAASHIGVLVHKAFNVSVPKPEDCEEWLGDYVFVGQEVKFTVTHLDFKGKLPFIRGDLISDGISHSTFNNGDSVDADAPEENTEALAYNAVNRNSVDEAEKKRAKKSASPIVGSGDETGRSDELPDEKLKAKPANGKKQFFDSSSDESSEDEDRQVQSRESQRKQQRVSGESRGSEDEAPRRSVKTKKIPEKLSKVNGDPDARTERPEPLDEKSKVKALKVEKPAKNPPPPPPPPPREAASSDASDEPEVPVDVESKVNSVKAEESPKKKKKKKKRSMDTEESPDTSSSVVSLKVEQSPKKNGTTESPAGSEIDEKPRINEFPKIEKSTKKKHKRVEIATSTPESSQPAQPVDAKFAVGELTTQVDTGESVVASPEKSLKKNCVIESDNEDTRHVAIKSETSPKKKAKSKKQREEVEEPREETFEFVKPEIKAEHKKKRRKSVVAENAESTESTSDFFQDVRIKVEPPSDVEDAATTEKRTKRKRKHSAAAAAVKEEADGTSGSGAAADEETSTYGNVGIKVEPDASDVEDAKPRKKKSKKRRSDENSFEHTRVKAEPNASDVEDAKPKRRVKSEPVDKKVRINFDS